MFASLRNRNYRLYAGGAVVSNVGTWMQRVAQDWLVLELTGSGTALGITTGLQFLPILLATPYGGLLADRMAKRRLLALTQTGMALSAVVLGVLAVTGVVQVWHVYLLALAFGTATAVDMAARQSFVVEIVGRDDLPNAVGLNSASFNVARIVGPALAGLLIVWLGSGIFGSGSVILLNAASYAAVIIALWRMRAEELQTPEPVTRQPGMIREGIRYVRSRPDLMLILAVIFCAGTFGLNFQMTTALMATQVYHEGAGEYGVLGSAMAVGSLAGALLAARRGRPRVRLVVGAALVFGLLEVAAGLMPTYLSFLLWLPLVGVAALTLITAANSAVQLGAPAHVRGRVVALYMTVFMGGTPLGAPMIGWLGEEFGARWTLIGGGLLTVLGTAVATMVLTRRNGLVVRAELTPRPHLSVHSRAPVREHDDAEQLGGGHRRKVDAA